MYYESTWASMFISISTISLFYCVLLTGRFFLRSSWLMVCQAVTFQQLRAVFPTVWRLSDCNEWAHCDWMETWTLWLVFSCCMHRPAYFWLHWMTVNLLQTHSVKNDQCEWRCCDPNYTGCIVQHEAAASAASYIPNLSFSSTSKLPAGLYFICYCWGLSKGGYLSLSIPFTCSIYTQDWCSIEDENSRFPLLLPSTFYPKCRQQLEAAPWWHLPACKSLQWWKLGKEKKISRVHEGGEERKSLLVHSLPVAVATVNCRKIMSKMDPSEIMGLMQQFTQPLCTALIHRHSSGFLKWSSKRYLCKVSVLPTVDGGLDALSLKKPAGILAQKLIIIHCLTQ